MCACMFNKQASQLSSFLSWSGSLSLVNVRRVSPSEPHTGVICMKHIQPTDYVCPRHVCTKGISTADRQCTTDCVWAQIHVLGQLHRSHHVSSGDIMWAHECKIMWAQVTSCELMGICTVQCIVGQFFCMQQFNSLRYSSGNHCLKRNLQTISWKSKINWCIL